MAALLSTLVCRCWASSDRRGGGVLQLAVGAWRARWVVVGGDGVFHRRRQPRQVVLEQVVAGAVAHGLHRRVLADLARHQDEGQQVLPALAQDLQRLQAGEARQVEVRQPPCARWCPSPEERRLQRGRGGGRPGRLGEGRRRDFDLVLTDQNMPRMDGISLTKKLRENPKFKATPILILTTESSDQMKQAGRAAGATGWLVKPFDPAKLIEVIGKVIR
jgi:two-component system chemotaxis response regulator CheY